MFCSRMEDFIQLTTSQRDGKTILVLVKIKLFHNGLKMNYSMHSGKERMLESFTSQTGLCGL